ncbi:MAG: saccharopine dehydrogenase NADP-binding domain-containing protein [Spirochaetales bacterium]|nr:saccharopine dehydrogenase NADP-binding domain-containing protein [Spirochaetales bacterium]
MKRVMIMGTGAQGSAVARLLDKEPNVTEIICADYDLKAAEDLGNSLSKARAVKVNAKDVEDIVKAGKGADIIVNGLPISFNITVMEAAIRLKAHYQDLCMTEIAGMDSIESTEYMFTKQNKKFEDAGVLAITNTGSAPGLVNIVVRETAEKFDSVDTIEMNVYEGVWSNKFVPFWWSPDVAFADMAEDPTRFDKGKHVKTSPFANPVMMKFPGVKKEIRMVDHSHEEPITMGLNADKYLKGAKNIVFRYGGPHIELSEALYKMGFLSHEKRTSTSGAEYVPFDLVIEHAPPAPKYKDEIKDIIDGGLVTEEGAFQVLVTGMKDGKPLKITVYVNAPGLIEAWEKSGISHEAYLTGQSAFIFTKMLVNDAVSQTGLISPEVLEADARKFFFDEAAKLEITFDEIIEHTIN